MIKSQHLQNRFKNIDEMLEKAKEYKDDSELACMLSGYLVVFISGIYEDCIERLFIERAGRNNDNEIKGLIEKLMDQKFRNPEYDKIKEILNYLNPEYGKDLRDKLDNKNIDGINSIVNNKNCIAHGSSSNITLLDVETYHKNALKIFEELENILS